MRMVGLYSLIFSLCKSDPVISLVLKLIEAASGVFAKSCRYCHVWKTSLWLLWVCSSQSCREGSLPLGLWGVLGAQRPGAESFKNCLWMGLGRTNSCELPLLVRKGYWPFQTAGALPSSLQLSRGWTDSWVKFRWQRSWTLLPVPLLLGGLLVHLLAW